LRKWESREHHRIRDHKERVRDESDYQEKLGKKKEHMSTYLTNFDDDEEEKRGQDDWFYDRDRWIERRRTYRQREADADYNDRHREQEESGFSVESKGKTVILTFYNI
jgi:hypothetical protein